MEINVSRFPTKNHYFAICCLEIIHSNKNHGLLGNPLIPIQDLNTNFHLEPKNRKPEIEYRRKYDVEASKNAEQAFSAPRLSSQFLLYSISGVRFFSPSN